MRRLALGWGLFFICAFVFGIVSPLLPSKTYLSSFTGALRQTAVSLPLAAVAALGLAAAQAYKRRETRAPQETVLGHPRGGIRAVGARARAGQHSSYGGATWQSNPLRAL